MEDRTADGLLRARPRKVDALHTRRNAVLRDIPRRLRRRRLYHVNSSSLGLKFFLFSISPSQISVSGSARGSVSQRRVRSSTKISKRSFSYSVTCLFVSQSVDVIGI